ncbi:hypothetical protein [Clostridium sp. C2-6-12]|uniref:hypothetical protein n=1 Tax=Clostridium sp. C2-6-12 TaxID=2698832 RepID=UPI00136E418C|nr:hypothetical protein [Clostridium sp. C2-6-12]
MAKYYKNYSDEVRKIINNTILTPAEDEKLKKCMKIIKPYLKNVFEDMYKLFISDLSCNETGNVYGKNERTIQYIFKKLDLERNLKDAQKIAVKKRDYISIRKSYKKTMLDRFVKTQLSGSTVEDVVRLKISQVLGKELFGKYEVIVGINTMTTVGELDIPVIIINDINTYKFGIEVNGKFFHKGKMCKDLNKKSNLEQLGYTIFKIDTKAYYRENSINNIKYYAELEEQIFEICNCISQIVLNK